MQTKLATSPLRSLGITLGVAFGVTLAIAGCRGRVVVEPREHEREECRTVEVRNPRERETCVTRCGDEGCRTRCREHERVSRERRCWVD